MDTFLDFRDFLNSPFFKYFWPMNLYFNVPVPVYPLFNGSGPINHIFNVSGPVNPDVEVLNEDSINSMSVEELR